MNAGSEEELSKAICRLKSENMRNKLSINAKNKVEETFIIAGCVDGLYCLYRGMGEN